MMFTQPSVSSTDLVHEIVRLLPEYLPGLETGSAANTEGRTCWIKSWKALLTAVGREHSFPVAVKEDGASALDRQLSLYWKQGDAIILAAHTGFGSRDDMERRFQQLEILKAPRKLILYSCLRWQQAVLDQLEAALLRYPHHIQGEEYVALNLMGPQQTLAAHLFRVPLSGSLRPEDVRAMAEVSGSPFSWGSARGHSASS